MTTLLHLLENGLLHEVGQISVDESDICLSWYEQEDVIYTGEDDLEGTEKTFLVLDVRVPEYSPERSYKIPYDSPVEFDGLEIHVKDAQGKDVCLSFQKLVDIDPEKFVKE